MSTSKSQTQKSNDPSSRLFLLGLIALIMFSIVGVAIYTMDYGQKELYPYRASDSLGSSVEECIASSGIVYNSTGPNYAKWFNFNGCAHDKFYNINGREKLTFQITTDSCLACVCTQPKFTVTEYSGKEVLRERKFDYPDKSGMSENLTYAPDRKVSEIRVSSDTCFYLRIYG